MAAVPTLSLLDYLFMYYDTLLAGAVEYANCNSTEG